MATRLQLPHKWKPRQHQFDVWNHCVERDSFRAMMIWHRRAGKDDVCLQMTNVKAHQRVGNYWYMLPEAAQARKAIWTAINPHTGRRRIDEAFPIELREKTNESEMYIKLKIGSTIQIVGSDNFSSLVGSPPIGIVFSEWALAKAQAWAYLRPILLENGGWALFNTTARGRNHAYRMLEGARKDKGWFAQVLSAKDTKVFTAAQLEQERQEYIRDYGPIIGEALFEQEYYCSFDAAIRGAYYTGEIRLMKEQGRLTNVPVEALPVNVNFDLGMGDDTALWFWQEVGREVRVLYCYHSHGVGLEHYVEKMEEWRKAQKIVPKWGRIILPHDGAVRELGTGVSRQETLASLIGTTPEVLKQWSFADGINAARRLFPRVWMHEDGCTKGLEALTQYRREYDEKHDAFYDKPVHDWTSHYADSFRYMGMSMRQPINNETGERKRIGAKIAIV